MTVNRRRALKIVAAVAGLPVLAAGVRNFAPALKEFRWQGEAMGAIADISLWHHDAAHARAAFETVRTEVVRYERMFSLFDQDSEISRLNRDGRIEKASTEFVELVGKSLDFGKRTDGAFDITVQPLWKLYESHFWTGNAGESGLREETLKIAQSLVDYRQVRVEGRSVSFNRPGMGITLNGIAQGYLTDKVADTLRMAGFESAVVDLGETRALGQHPDGRPWRLGVKDPVNPGQIARTLEASDMALAVSGGYGTTFDASGRFHHLFDPATGESAHRVMDVAVLSPRAADADALATALCIMESEKAPALLAQFASSKAYVTRRDGSRVMADAKGLQAIG